MLFCHHIYMPTSDTKNNTKKIILSLGALIILLVVGATIFGASIKDSPFFSSSKPSAQQKEAEDLVEKVGKLIVLPLGNPTIATVSDKSQLAGQPFFVSAENGDKVLIYTESKKAILYRPSLNKIIEVGPVVEEVSPTSSPSPSSSVRPSPSLSPSPSEIEVEKY